ncbi:class I SAM-dependent methyltransferase [Rossellomorea marisflavi]|uniref:class I SAM-dependent methyltransferase n=2 Tax=Rossellomorea marisflavi TaxID=189381 RepID=UPI0035689B89
MKNQMQMKGTSMMKDIFTKIYKENIWGSEESVSGTGSSMREAQGLLKELPLLFDSLNIQSILDAPCGDFNWMKHVDLSNYHYVGVDIVSEIIKKNQTEHASRNIQFIEGDIMKDPLPKVDLIICRDALVHFPFHQVEQSIDNFLNSGSTYVLLTHFPLVPLNKDIPLGHWRPLNLCLPPFSFPEPTVVLEETLRTKTMALWKLEQLRRQ